MKRIISFILAVTIFVPSAFANYTIEDVQKIKNDKEAISRELSKNEIKKIQEKYENSGIANTLTPLLHEVLLNFANVNRDEGELSCEFNVITDLKAKLAANNLFTDKESLEEYFKILRVKNQIDDLLYAALNFISHDYHGVMEAKAVKRNKKVSKKKTAKLEEHNKVEELYSRFTTWPNNKTNCVENEYFGLLKGAKNKKGEEGKKNSLKHLNRLALEKGVISKLTFSRLEFLRKKGKLNKRYIFLEKYLDIVFNVKNRLKPQNLDYEIKDVTKEDTYNQDKVQRLKKLTRRRLLYQRYSATQIIMLAEVLHKASQRMGTDPDTITGKPVISQDFNVLQPDGTRKNYVEKIELTEQEQYNLARKLLRRDINQLRMMDTFLKREISYHDVVVAAFETGYISFEDLEHVIMYDDLWYPGMTKFEKVMMFIFTIAGFATFYVPPPWNATVAVALTVIQGLIFNRNMRGSENDNPNSIID